MGIARGPTGMKHPSAGRAAMIGLRGGRQCLLGCLCTAELGLVASKLRSGRGRVPVVDGHDRGRGAKWAILSWILQLLLVHETCDDSAVAVTCRDAMWRLILAPAGYPKPCLEDLESVISG